MMPDRFCPDHYPYGAYVVVTLDARTGQVKRAGIYSAPARGLTSNLREDILLDGPSCAGGSYAEALKALRRVLSDLPNWRHLRERVHGFKPEPGEPA